MSCAAYEVYGLECPECGSSDDIVITVTAFARLTDDGPEPSPPFAWSESSDCLCDNCKETGTVADFRIQREEQSNEQSQ